MGERWEPWKFLGSPMEGEAICSSSLHGIFGMFWTKAKDDCIVTCTMRCHFPQFLDRALSFWALNGCL